MLGSLLLCPQCFSSALPPLGCLFRLRIVRCFIEFSKEFYWRGGGVGWGGEGHSTLMSLLSQWTAIKLAGQAANDNFTVCSKDLIVPSSALCKHSQIMKQAEMDAATRSQDVITQRFLLSRPRYWARGESCFQSLQKLKLMVKNLLILECFGIFQLLFWQRINPKRATMWIFLCWFSTKKILF